jgi:hypothetical protein
VRALLSTLIGACLYASATGHAAAADAQRSVVVVAEGSDADSLASSFSPRMHGSLTVRDARDFRASLGGGPAPLAAGLKSRRADGELVARARAAAANVQVDVAILLHVRKARRATVVHVWLVEAAPGGASVDRELTLGPGASPGDEGEAAWNALKDAFTTESPAPAAPVATESSPPPPASATTPPEPADAGRAPEREADGLPQPAASDRGPSLLRFGAAIEAGSRHFAYVDRLTPTLRPYDLFAAPLASVRIEALPLARSASPVLSGFGVAAEYSRAFGVSSADAAGTPVSTTWQAFHADVREMVAIGPAVLAGGHAGFGIVDFTFDGSLGAGAELPSAGYRFARAGLDGRVRLGDFSVYAGASYLVVLSTGAMGSLFPRESTGGVDAVAGLLWPIARHFDLSFALAYTRFFYSFNPQPGDSNVAGGALDEMARASLGLAYSL